MHLKKREGHQNKQHQISDDISKFSRKADAFFAQMHTIHNTLPATR